VGSLGLYYINRLIARGPQDPAIEPLIGAHALPLSAAAERGRKVLVETGS
jgi:hypothetical protein